MDKTSKISDIELLESSLINRPCDKHTDDHTAIRSSMRILLNIVKKLEEKIWDNWKAISSDGQDLSEINKKLHDTNKNVCDMNDHLRTVATAVQILKASYPKISIMQKNALIVDGENVIDTVNIDSWRYLLVKSITPTDWNEYAKLDKTFSWEIIEVTNWEYDVKVDLNTNTQWETATMTINVDLLFIKY